jgi:hypothetical protein
MKATMILCDHAQIADGKLYILGAAWAAAETSGQPIDATLAVIATVDWTETNTPHWILAKLIDEHQRPVTIKGAPLQREAKLEVGRPAGTKPNSTITAQPIILTFERLRLHPGNYTFQLTINNQHHATTPFHIH